MPMFEPHERYADRRDAGRTLAGHLDAFAHRPDIVVLALPRGGVPVAYEVATALDAPLDVLLVRKLGVPEYPELAAGAIASGGVRVLNDHVVEAYALSPDLIDDIARREQAELERAERRHRDGRPPLEPAGRVAIVVDDGLATGATMRAAVQAVRARGAARVVVAVPVGAAEGCRDMATVADEVVCPSIPAWFEAVGLHYRDFSPTSDDEVRRLLTASRRALDPPS